MVLSNIGHSKQEGVCGLPRTEQVITSILSHAAGMVVAEGVVVVVVDEEVENEI